MEIQAFFSLQLWSEQIFYRRKGRHISFHRNRDGRDFEI